MSRIVCPAPSIAICGQLAGSVLPWQCPLAVRRFSPAEALAVYLLAFSSSASFRSRSSYASEYARRYIHDGSLKVHRVARNVNAQRRTPLRIPPWYGGWDEGFTESGGSGFRPGRSGLRTGAVSQRYLGPVLSFGRQCPAGEHYDGPQTQLRTGPSAWLKIGGKPRRNPA